MINKITASLAMSLLSLTCFASDSLKNDLLDSLSSSLSSLPPQEINVALPSLTDIENSTSFSENELSPLISPSFTPKGKRIKDSTWRNAEEGDEDALQLLIDSRWYTRENVYTLISLMVKNVNEGSTKASGLLSKIDTTFRYAALEYFFDHLFQKIEDQDKTAQTILDALIMHTPLENYLSKKHDSAVLAFISFQAFQSPNPDFNYQEKLLLAYREGHYGIKKNYKRIKRDGFNIAKYCALNSQNPKAQAILLLAYRNGQFGIKKNSHLRLNEAVAHLQDFAQSTDTQLQKLIAQALGEGWFGLAPQESYTRDSSLTSPLQTKEEYAVAVYHHLIAGITEDLAQKIYNVKSPMQVLHDELDLIVTNGVNGDNRGAKKNRRIALDTLKSLAIDHDYYPAQTLLIHAYHDGIFGINANTKCRKEEGLNYLNLFAHNNHHVQMLQLKALTQGWFDLEPSNSKTQSQTLQLAKEYAKQGNRKAQKFLINAYVQGLLGTKSDKYRQKKAMKLREKYNIYPASPRSQASNRFAILSTLQ